MLLRRYLSLTITALALLSAAGVPARADDKKVPVANLAHIRLHGDLDEAPVGADPLFGTAAENFKTKLDRIKKARNDSSVQGLYLQIDEVALGWGRLDELRRALADFRATGKKVYAFLESGEGKDYLLAAACDEVCLPESGWLMLTGIRAEVSFYKDLFDKIGVKADMLQMGTFKGAAEPYTRSSMSPEFRKQFETVLDDYYEKSLVGALAKARKKTPAEIKKLIDQGPYTAKAAKEAGLIDRVAYADSFQDGLKDVLHADKVKVTKNYGQAKAEELDFSNPFALFKLLSPAKTASSREPKVAVIYATGVITSGKSAESLLGGSTVGSTTLIEAIRQAEQDRTVKAIVLRVDSPGGSALASDLIWNELNKCKKPVIASMGDTAASGGYYISMAARKIYAEPGTLTGSIGVVGGKITLGGLYDKVGLKTEVITRGANANILSTTTPFSETERQAMTNLMKDVYRQFLEKAILGREKAGKPMVLADLEVLAGGRIWTGRQAKANGLIDELGTLNDAVAAGWQMAGMSKETEPEWLILPKPRTFLDTLLEYKSETLAPPIGSRVLLRELPELAGPLGSLGGLLRLRGEPVWAVLPCRIEKCARIPGEPGRVSARGCLSFQLRTLTRSGSPSLLGVCMARCEQGYLCDVCGQDVAALTDSDLYLRYVLGEVPPEQLHVLRERHLRCNPSVAQFIVDPAFAPARCEGAFAKENLDPAYVAELEARVTRGWRRLQEIPTLGVPIIEYPLPEVRAGWGAG